MRPKAIKFLSEKLLLLFSWKLIGTYPSRCLPFKCIGRHLKRKNSPISVVWPFCHVEKQFWLWSLSQRCSQRRTWSYHLHIGIKRTFSPLSCFLLWVVWTCNRSSGRRHLSATLDLRQPSERIDRNINNLNVDDCTERHKLLVQAIKLRLRK